MRESLATIKFQSGSGFDMIIGHTRFYALLGHPIGHVQTPQADNTVFGARSHDGVMVSLDVPSEWLSDVITGLAMAGHDVRGMRVLLIGAGGAARAIAFALAEHRASAITALNRPIEKSRDLVDALRTLFVDTAFSNFAIRASTLANQFSLRSGGIDANRCDFRWQEPAG